MNQNLITRGLTRVSSLWRPTANRPPTKSSEPPTPLPAKQVRDLRTRLSDCARELGGQVTARTRAAALGDTYRAFDDAGKFEFLCLLVHDFGPDPKLVEQAH